MWGCPKLKYKRCFWRIYCAMQSLALPLTPWINLNFLKSSIYQPFLLLLPNWTPLSELKVVPLPNTSEPILSENKSSFCFLHFSNSFETVPCSHSKEECLKLPCCTSHSFSCSGILYCTFFSFKVYSLFLMPFTVQQLLRAKEPGISLLYSSVITSHFTGDDSA